MNSTVFIQCAYIESTNLILGIVLAEIEIKK